MKFYFITVICMAIILLVGWAMYAADVWVGIIYTSVVLFVFIHQAIQKAKMFIRSDSFYKRG